MPLDWQSTTGNLAVMELSFTKMHGLGNDFMVVNAIDEPVILEADQIRQLADRHFGIGFDQLLMLSQPVDNGADVSYRIFNSDGGEVSQCGNGARCIAVYLYERGIITKQDIIAETREGLLTLHRLENGQVRVNMGVPRLEPAEIPINVSIRAREYTLAIDDENIKFVAVSMGNPHAVLTVEDVMQAPVETLGPVIQHDKLFPEGVNVGFMQVVDRSSIHLRVYERGAGETLACGSGACAAVVAGRLQEKLDESVKVGLNGGQLLVSWKGEGEPVFMTGPATFVYDGRVTL